MGREWRVGDLIDGIYEVKEIVGKGGQGTVYRVFHSDWNLELAVKTPLPELVSERVSKERFLREAHTWIDLGVHPNIVRCWFVRENEGLPMLFLDYMPGGNLKQWRKEGRVHPGEWQKILDLIIQACDGLAYAHSLGVVHRDVKPANFLIREDGRLCVTDFGLVKVTEMDEPIPLTARAALDNIPEDLDEGASLTDNRDEESSVSSWSLTRTGTILGTPEYGAPEQWTASKNISHRADIYALGGVLYELCCGRRPFDDGSRKTNRALLIGRHLSREAPDPRVHREDIPSELSQLILWCLAKDPHERPASMSELRERLIKIYRDECGSAFPRSVPRPGVQRADALNNKAVSLWNLGMSQQAFSSWREASKLDAVHPETVHNRSILQWRLGQIGESEVEQRLTQARAAYPSAGVYLGFFHLEASEPAAAEKELTRALNRPELSRDSIAWRTLGDARMYQQRFPEAEQAYSKALALAPHDGSARRRLELAQTSCRKSERGILFPLVESLSVYSGQKGTTCLALDHQGLVVAGGSGMERWSLEDGRRLWQIGAQTTPSRLQIRGEKLVSLETPRGQAWQLANGVNLGGLTERDRFFQVLRDGEQALAGTVELGLVSLLDWQTRVRFEGHTKRVTSVALSPDEMRFLSGACDNTVRLWELESGRCLQLLEGHTDFVEALAITGDGALGISGGRDHGVRLWELDSGHCVWSRQADGEVGRLLPTADGKHLVVAYSRGEGFEVWDLERGQRLFRRNAAHVELDSGGGFVVASVGNEAVIWEVPSGRRLRVLRGHQQEISALALSADAALLASADPGGELRLWELAEQTRVFQRELVVIRTQSHAESERTRDVFLERLAAAQKHVEVGELGSAYRELLRARSVFGYRRDPEALRLNAMLLGQLARSSLASGWILRELAEESPTQALVISDDGKVAVSATGKFLLLWECASGSCLRGFTGHSDQIKALALASGAGRVLSGGLDGAVKLWSLETGDCLNTLDLGLAEVNEVALSPDARFASAATTDGQLFLWDLENGALTCSIEAEGKIAALTPDCQTGWVVGPGQMTVWDLFHEKRRFKDKSPDPFPVSLDITNDGRLAIAGGGDLLEVWDLQGRRRLSRLFSPAPVRSVRLFQGGAYAVSAGEDGYLRFWDVKEACARGSLRSHDGAATLVTVTADGRFLVSAGEDGSLRLWELDWELDPDTRVSTSDDIVAGGGLLNRFSSLFRRT